MPSPVLVSQRSAKASAKDVLFRDPESFVAGEIHRHVGEWEKFLFQTAGGLALHQTQGQC